MRYCQHRRLSVPFNETKAAGYSAWARDRIAAERVQMLPVTLVECIATCNIALAINPMTVRTSVADRVRKHRIALRAADLRPVQIWVPDSRRAGFAEECRRQCLVIRRGRAETGILDWPAEAADTMDWK